MKIVSHPQAGQILTCRILYFSTVQYLRDQTSYTNIDHLVSVVAINFQETGSVSLSKVWQSLQICLEEAMKFKEENEYCMLHGDKK